jgi:deazaflavin-dependent oxidoreductase (nitroreductase family)
MSRWLVRLVIALAVTVAGFLAVLVAGLRTGYAPVVDAVRRVNRVVWNPRAMRTAGAPGADASVIRHTGRSSGRVYETPVGVVPTGDGVLIALPYGSRADWLKNVLASGSATIVHEGSTFTVDRPVIVATSEVAEHFRPDDLRALRVFGVNQCLQLRCAPVTAV